MRIKKCISFYLPLQSGDNNLLREMNRGYNINDFLDIVYKFRKISKDTILATDIIVGHQRKVKSFLRIRLRL